MRYEHFYSKLSLLLGHANIISCTNGMNANLSRKGKRGSEVREHRVLRGSECAWLCPGLAQELCKEEHRRWHVLRSQGIHSAFLNEVRSVKKSSEE